MLLLNGLIVWKWKGPVLRFEDPYLPIICPYYFLIVGSRTVESVPVKYTGYQASSKVKKRWETYESEEEWHLFPGLPFAFNYIRGWVVRTPNPVDVYGDFPNFWNLVEKTERWREVPTEIEWST